MNPRADIVVDLAFGDAGKGATVDYLAHQNKPDWVIRYNGGAQAAHNVVQQDGRHHCFHQFGSALLGRPGARTYLSEHVLFDPYMAVTEQNQLHRLGVDATLVVHPDAIVVTPWHVAMNQIREQLRRIYKEGSEHGSCGMGIGDARSDALNGLPTLRAKDLDDSPGLREKLKAILDWKLEQVRQMAIPEGRRGFFGLIPQLLLDESKLVPVLGNLVEMFNVPGLFEVADYSAITGDYLIFEGAQGVLLDEWVGFHPHTTWTDTTTRNAFAILEKLPRQFEPTTYGILRAYGSRHGAGPFPSEDKATGSWGLKGEHNDLGPWQGSFRTGWFDLPLAQYAIRAAGKPDKLVLTCLDRLRDAPNINAVVGYRGISDREALPWQKDVLIPPEYALDMPTALKISSGMTDALMRTHPEWNETFSSPEELAQWIRRELALPKGWDSYGPTADPKTKQTL